MARTHHTTPRETSPVLAAARERTRTIALAEAERFELATVWAAAHPAPVEDDVVDELGDLIMVADQPVTLAGEGAPAMSEFAISEFALACGMSAYQGRAYIGAALEAKHRLPRIWARTMRGEIPVWKVRKITERTHRLTPAGAAYVDQQLHRILETCTFTQIITTTETAAAETDDEHEEGCRAERWEQQHLDINLHDTAGNTGLVPISGLLAYADALALEEAVRAGAAVLAEEFPDLGLDIRRAMATGRLGTDHGPQGAQRKLVLYAHYNPTDAHGIVDVEGVHGGLTQLGHTTIEQIEEWCRYNATAVTIRPVLDLDTERRSPGYRPSPALREQVILTCPTCVFPGCAKPARGCDLDHIHPYATGGPTTSWNLAPLCRLHHRMKTFGYWTYTRLTRTTFRWTSRHGQTYTSDLTHRRRRTRC